MYVVIYESMDTTISKLIEQSLNDNDIPCTVTGGLDINIVGLNNVKISVPNEFVHQAKNIIKQITG